MPRRSRMVFKSLSLPLTTAVRSRRRRRFHTDAAKSNSDKSAQGQGDNGSEKKLGSTNSDTSLRKIQALTGRSVTSIRLARCHTTDEDKQLCMEMMHEAAANDRKVVVRRLLDSGVDVNAVVAVQTGDSALHLCAAAGHSAVCLLLLSRGADPNIQNTNGETPLHLCCRANHKEIVMKLVNRGGNLNIQNNDGYSPLHVAAYHGNGDVVRMLIVRGAEITAETKGAKFQPLHLALIQRHVRAAKMLSQASSRRLLTKEASSSEDKSIDASNAITSEQGPRQRSRSRLASLAFAKGHKIKSKGSQWCRKNNSGSGGQKGQRGGDVSISPRVQQQPTPPDHSDNRVVTNPSSEKSDVLEENSPQTHSVVLQLDRQEDPDFSLIVDVEVVLEALSSRRPITGISPCGLYVDSEGKVRKAPPPPPTPAISPAVA